MAPEREGILFITRDPAFARVIFSDQSRAQVDIGVAVHQRRIRRDLVAPHRHHAHRLCAARDRRRAEPAHDPFCGEGNGLQARRAEPVDRRRRRLDRNACAETRDARDVQSLLRLRHCASQDHVVDIGRLDAGGAAQHLGDDRCSHFVRSHRPQRAVRRLADGGSRRRDDYCVLHEKSSSKSTRASPTSPAWPSKR